MLSTDWNGKEVNYVLVFLAFSKPRLPSFEGANVRGERLAATMCSLLCTIQMIHGS